jgi:hypothetical protein
MAYAHDQLIYARTPEQKTALLKVLEELTCKPATSVLSLSTVVSVLPSQAYLQFNEVSFGCFFPFLIRFS